MSRKRWRRPRPSQQGSTQPEQPAPADARLLDLEAVKLTDVGRVRPHNEDFVDCHIPTDREQIDRKGAMYLVADGMGGHQAGEVASQGAVESVIRSYYSDLDHDVGTSLVRAFRVANQRIHEQALADPSKVGMGTTLVAAVILGAKVFVANVGDSRAYLIGKTGITQITEDHSWVEEQVRAGLLTPEQARRHPQRNLVTRALGSKPAVEVDLFEGQLGKGDILLLCTDGLTGHVEDLEIEAAVREHPPKEAVQLLVAKANERGGSDNISVLIVGGRQAVATAPTVIREPARSFPWIPVLAGLAGLLVLVAAVLLFLLRPGKGTPTPSPQLTPMATMAATEPVTGTVPATNEAAPPVGVTLTPTGAPNPSGEAGPAQPTETLAPTQAPNVATPTQAPQATVAAVGPTTPAVAAQPTPLPAPTLLEPTADQELRNKPRFTWQWAHEPLTGNHFFDLRIWSQQEEEAGTTGRGAIQPTKSTEAEVDLALVPAIQDYGLGIYYWTVVVVEDRESPRVVGHWGEERRFQYVGAPQRDPERKLPLPPDPGPFPGPDLPDPIGDHGLNGGHLGSTAGRLRTESRCVGPESMTEVAARDCGSVLQGE